MIFKRVLVGFDGSPGSERALTAARALRAEDGSLVALTVAETHYATHAGMDAVAWDETLRAHADRLRSACADLLDGLPGCHAGVTTGHAPAAIVRAAKKLDADLICIGAKGRGRVSGILLGGAATRIVHDAHCSVLVARGYEPMVDFPAAIVVGVDESAASIQAAHVASALARSTGAAIRHLQRRPVDGLVDASRSADLLVVGSRGLHGLPAVRSVAERVAHEAACPVLIVRDTASHATRRSASHNRASLRAGRS
jgi:nucleotide-binding universal stress UspA family protein